MGEVVTSGHGCLGVKMVWTEGSRKRPCGGRVLGVLEVRSGESVGLLLWTGPCPLQIPMLKPLPSRWLLFGYRALEGKLK